MGSRYHDVVNFILQGLVLSLMSCVASFEPILPRVCFLNGDLVGDRKDASFQYLHPLNDPLRMLWMLGGF